MAKNFLDSTGLLTLVEELKKYIDESSNVIKKYNSIYEFPGVGEEGILYLNTSTNSIYRWDDDNIKYYCVGSDYNNIEIINGGSSN